MAKQKKPNHIEIPPVPREAIADVQGEEDFVELLRRELEWPIPMSVERLADVAIPHDLQSDFGFKPEEERIGVSRLLTLAEDQPWGVFNCLKTGERIKRQGGTAGAPAMRSTNIWIISGRRPRTSP